MVSRLCLLLALLSHAAWAANTLVIHANVITVDKPRKVPAGAIKDIVLEATYLAGEKVYARADHAAVMRPQPPLNYGDGSYGDGDEEENQSLWRPGETKP